MTNPLLKRFIAKATPDTRVSARRIAITAPNPQTRARRAEPKPANRKHRTPADRVVAIIRRGSAVKRGCILYKRVASERFNL